MRTTKRIAIVVLVLSAAGIAQAGQVTVVNWSGSADIPDNDEYATSYLISSAPSGAIVTGVSYDVLVDDRGVAANFWCSDYEIGLSSTARGGTADYLLVWDNAGGQTDSGADDDLANDSDIDLDDSASAFDGQAVNQRWYLVVKDNVSHVGTYKGLGSLKAVTLTIQYVAPPSATTQAATSVTATSATLNGTVSNDGGEACQYRFRYKKEGGSYAYTAYTGSKLTGESFSLALTGLDPGATYYFAAQAKNSAGESTWPGSDTSFTTPPLVPTVSTQPATSVTSTSATLNGRVTNDGGAACQYRFRSKESGTISYTESSWTGSVRTGESFNLPIPSGLSPGTTYVFAAKLKNSAGESAWGSELSFTTPPAKPVATTQAATGITSTGATLNGTVSNYGGEACQYRFRHKKEGGSYTYTTYTGSKTTGQSFSEALTGLDPGTTYYFAAQVKNSAGESNWPASDTSFTTPAILPTVSTQPATGITSTSATANGTVTNDGGAACQYRFRCHEFGGAYTYSDWAGSKRTGESFSFTLSSGLSPNKTYYFAAQLKNSAGEGVWGSELSFTTMVEKPVASTVPATDVAATSATLNGRIVNDGGVACEYRFRYMKQGGSYTYTTYTGSKTTGQYFSYALTGLDPGSTYYFAAQAKNSAGESTWPGSDTSFTTPAVLPTATTQAATSVASTSATLNGSVANDGGAACQYRFRSKEFGAASYTESSWTGSLRTGQSFSLAIPSGLSPGKTYVFAAQLKNSAGEGEWGSTLNFTTPFGQPVAGTLAATDIGPASATLNGRIADDGGAACQYHFRYKKEGGSYSYTTYTGSLQTGQYFTHTLTGLDPEATYYFAAQAKNSAGESSWPGTDASFTTVVVAPTVTTMAATNVTPTSATANGRVVDDGGAACQYRFRAKEFGASSYTYIDWTGSVRTGQSFSFTLPVGLSPGTTYYFAAQLRNSAGEGEWGSNLTIVLPVAKPVAGTLAATDVDGNSATLNGRITDDGSEACEYRFRYKKQGGDYVYTAYTGSEQTGHTFSYSLTGLDREATHYFSAQARNSAGESNWPPTDASFITHVLPPTATTLPATDITTVSATLNGRVAKDGGAVCQYRFRCREFGAIPLPEYTYSPWTGAVTANQPFSFALPPGLSPGKTYVFAAQLKNSTGEGLWGSDLNFTAPCLKPIAATKPATFVSPTGATLNGMVVNDGGEACSCQFKYRIVPDRTYKYLYVTGEPKRTGAFFSYELAGTPGAICQYAARVINSAGPSDWPTENQSFTFGVTRPTVTTEPAEDVTPDTGCTATMRLSGKLVDDGSVSCEYQFRYRKNKQESTPVEGGPVLAPPPYIMTPWRCCRRTGQTFTHDQAGLDPNCTYEYAARAKNSAGEGEWGDTLTFKTPRLLPKVTHSSAEDVTPQTASGTATMRLRGKLLEGTVPCEVQFWYRRQQVPIDGKEFYVEPYVEPNSTPWRPFSQVGEVFTYDQNGLDPNCVYEFGVRAKNCVGEHRPDGHRTFKTPVVKPIVMTLPATEITPQVTLNGMVINDGGDACSYGFAWKRIGATTWTGEEGWLKPRKRTGESFSQTLPLDYFSPGITYCFIAQACNSAGWSDGPELTLTIPYGPEITDIRGTHFSKAVFNRFLDGVSLDENITVHIDWKGLHPLCVLWRIVNSATGEVEATYQTDCRGLPSEQVSRTFDVGALGVGRRLNVKATAGEGLDSVQTIANFATIPPPELESDTVDPIEFKAVSSPMKDSDMEALTYETGWYRCTVFGDSAGDFGYTLPDWIPIIGGYGVSHVLKVKGKMTVWPMLGSAMEVMQTDVAEVHYGGDTVDVDFGYLWQAQYFADDAGGGYWFGFGTIIEEANARHSYWSLDLTLLGYGLSVDLGLDLDLFNSYTWGPPWTGLVKVDPALYAKGDLDLEVLSAKAKAKGGLKFHVRYPQYQASKAELEKLCVNMSLSVEGCIGTWKFKECASWHDSWPWCPVDKTDSQSSSVSVASLGLDEGALGTDGAEWELMTRDYIGPNYAVWQPSAPENRRDQTALSILASPPEMQMSSGEQVLQTNVFENSQPALAADNGRLFLAWVWDDPNRSSVDRDQVVFSRSDKGTWTPPAPVWDDGTVDMSPQLATLPSGQVLCVWENVNRSLPDDAEFKDMVSAMDIAVASYDATTGLWSPKALTSDSHLDRTPRIAAAANGTAIVVWVSNKKDNILGLDPNAPDTIQYCLWNGSTWSEPGTAAVGIGYLLKTALAYNGTQAVYLYAIDTDGDRVTSGDRELYGLIYEGARWSQPIRLTNDKVRDANPQVVYDQGEPLLVWYRDKSIVSCRGLDTSALKQALQPSGVGAMDFRLAKSPAGRISLVWTGLSATVEGVDVFTATYDPLFGLWSDPYALTSDQDNETALAATYVNSDELALAYNKDRITTNDEGDQETYQTDLCVLRHTIGSDLAVTAADISMDKANPKPGDSVTITAVIHNLGDVAEANVPVAFYQGNPADGGVLIGAVQTIKGLIPAAGTGQASVSWTIPDANSAQSVYVVVDPQSDREERSLTNNVAFIAVTTADLTVKSLYPEKTGHKARRINAWVANDGVAPAYDVGVAIRRDSPQGQELKSFTIPVINVGSNEKVSWDWDISDTEFSTPEITLCVVVDPDQRVPESNEKNNTALCPIQVNKTADITDDGSVDYDDLTALSEGWLGSGADSEGKRNGDTNHDGRIDMADFSILGQDWGWETIWHTD